MDDLISRQAVLSEIETVCFSKEWREFRLDYGSNGERDYIINYIKQLPSVQPEQKWIPVGERLPEDNIKVLVSTETAVGFASNDDIGWYIRDGYIDGIIAWMPLPEPYIAESEE